MTVELNLLLWSAALTLLQMIVAVAGTTLQVGIPALSGNRERMQPVEGWAGRARRAHQNMLENIVLFAVLVLTAQLVGKSNGMTVLGANLFFWARVIYLPIYVFGVPWVRTGVWAVSIVGLILIFHQLV